MLQAQASQSFRHQLVSAAVEGGIDHLEVVRHLLHHLFVDGLSHDLLQKRLVGLFAQDLDKAGIHSLVKIAGLEAGENVYGLHLLCNGVGLVGGQLGPVGPVDLIAVVLLGIVAGSDVEPGGGAIKQHGKAQLRGGAQ